jgi:dethiobiotin synthetase
VVSAALLHRFSGEGGVRLRYWKPIQTGVEVDDDTRTVRELAPGGAGAVVDQGIRLAAPVSPHLAARLAGQRIDLDHIAALAGEQPRADRWIVEGAGGVLVPVNESALMVDVMRLLGLPVLIAARSTLGTINHTLLTLEALRARSIVVSGVVMVGPPDAANREAIEAIGEVPVVGELPVLTPLTPATLGAWAAASLDRAGALQGLLQ